MYDELIKFLYENGVVISPFTGEQFIRTNDFKFYIGDFVWETVKDKLGNWIITTYYKGK